MIYRARQQQPLHAFAAIMAYLLMLSVGLLEGMLYHPIKIILALVMIAPLFARSSGSGKPDAISGGRLRRSQKERHRVAAMPSKFLSISARADLYGSRFRLLSAMLPLPVR